jgi:hypothetical protein
MNVNHTTLRRIQLYRTVHDPVIPHEGAEGWLDTHESPQERARARRQRLRRTPPGARMEFATLPETVTWAQTASTDARLITAKFAALFTALFKRYAAEIHGQDSNTLLDNVGGALMGDPDDEGPWPNPDLLGQHNEEFGTDHEPVEVDADSLVKEHRRRIKLVQDKLFVDEVYDQLPFDTSGVPKAFWEVPVQNELDLDETPESDGAQTGLNAF